MKIEDIVTEVEKYLQIDETNLAKESLETPVIYGKVLRMRTNESLLLQQLSFRFKKLYNEKKDYYLGRATPEVYKAKPFNQKVYKTEVDSYIEADDDIIELSMKLEVQKEKVVYLDAALKQIGNRGYQIRNAIDFQKLMSGVF